MPFSNECYGVTYWSQWNSSLNVQSAWNCTTLPRFVRRPYVLYNLKNILLSKKKVNFSDLNQPFPQVLKFPSVYSNISFLNNWIWLIVWDGLELHLVETINFVFL